MRSKHEHSALSIIEAMVEAIASILTAEEPDSADFEPWIAFERDLRTTWRDTHLGKLVEGMELTSFDVQVVAALAACHIDPVLRHACVDRSRVAAAGPAASWLVEKLCHSTQARLEGWVALQPGGRLAPAVLQHHDSPTSGAAEIVTLTPSTLNFILGRNELPEHVAAVAGFVDAPFPFLDVIMPVALREQARQLAVDHDTVRSKLEQWGGKELMPVGGGVSFLLSGPSGTGKTVFARALAADLDIPLLVVKCPDLPDRGAETLLRDLAGQAGFYGAAVLFDECEALFGAASPRRAAGLAALDYFFRVPCLLVTNYPDRLDPAVDRRVLLHIPFERPDAEARRQLWEVHIPRGMPVDGRLDLDILADRYELTGGQINNAVRVAVSKAICRDPTHPQVTEALLVEGCESQLRSSLETFTTRSTTKLRLDDIVLPAAQREQVEEFVAAIQNNAMVMNTWGMKDRLMTGKGLVALFDGPPGTGKTLCAEIIAATMGKPLFRVNLPSVVSKWVGETEKHIQAIFREARASRAMLLFDEADALFASRTHEVRSSNDRHSNMEVNLLLQEVERFDGVAMLTTNKWGILDDALKRRIQLRVSFEEPGEEQRLAIWKKLISPRLPLADDIDLETLAQRFDFSGGRIKNALLRAARLAAKDGTPVTQQLLVQASLGEASAAGKASRDPAAANRDKAARLAAVEQRLLVVEPSTRRKRPRGA